MPIVEGETIAVAANTSMAVRGQKTSVHKLAPLPAPNAEQHAAGRGAACAQPSLAGPRGRRPVLLIADDEALVRRVLERLARKLGYDVLLCENGTQAIEVAVDRRPDVALVDLRMPGADGLSVLRAVRADVPHAAVIIMTAYAAVDSAVEAIKLGAREYMSKPLDFSALRTTLADLTAELDSPAVPAQAELPIADGPSVTTAKASAAEPCAEGSARPRRLLLVRRTDKPVTPKAERRPALLRVVRQTKVESRVREASPADRRAIPTSTRARRPRPAAPRRRP